MGSMRFPQGDLTDRLSETAGYKAGLALSIEELCDHLTGTEYPELIRNSVVALIENHFSIVLDDIEGWASIRDLRAVVNAYKHRRGFKHLREMNWRSKDVRFPERYTLDQEEVKEALSRVASFFRALKSALDGRRMAK